MGIVNPENNEAMRELVESYLQHDHGDKLIDIISYDYDVDYTDAMNTFLDNLNGRLKQQNVYSAIINSFEDTFRKYHKGLEPVDEDTLKETVLNKKDEMALSTVFQNKDKEFIDTFLSRVFNKGTDDWKEELTDKMLDFYQDNKHLGDFNARMYAIKNLIDYASENYSGYPV